MLSCSDRERDAQLAELVSLRESLAQAQDRQSRLETEKDEAEMKISELSQDIQMRNNEVQREMRKKVMVFRICDVLTLSGTFLK